MLCNIVSMSFSKLIGIVGQHEVFLVFQSRFMIRQLGTTQVGIENRRLPCILI